MGGESILICIYMVWALFVGYRLMRGRSEWWDRKKWSSRIVKFFVCWFVGGITGAFYLVYLVFAMWF